MPIDQIIYERLGLDNVPLIKANPAIVKGIQTNRG